MNSDSEGTGVLPCWGERHCHAGERGAGGEWHWGESKETMIVVVRLEGHISIV